MYFRPYPVLFTDDVLPASAQYDFISYLQLHVGTDFADSARLAYSFHKQTFVLLLEVYFEVYDPFPVFEPFVFDAVGAESDGARGVHEAGLVCLGVTHAGFQILAGGFYLIQTAQHFRSDGRQHPGRAGGTENVGYGIRHRNDVDVTLPLSFVQPHIGHCIFRYADDGGYGLRAGKQPRRFSHVISHEQGKQPGHSQNGYAHQHCKGHLRQSVFLQSAEKLRAYLVAYGKQEQQEKYRLDRAGYGNIQLAYHYAYQQHAGDGS